MDDNKRSALEQRRQQLQLKIQAETYIERHIKSARELFDDLRQHEVTFEIAGLVYTPMEYRPYIEQTIVQPMYNKYRFQSNHLQSTALEQLLDTLFDQYPSINPLRYVPNLPKYADYSSMPSKGGLRDGLQKVVHAMGLQNQNVYVYYLQYALVLKASLRDLCTHDHEDMFNTWHGEVVIFTDHPDWLITFTLEEEWLGGQK